MEWLVGAHEVMSSMVATYALLVGIWGLVNFLLKRAPDGYYNGALALGVALFVLEGAAGIVLVLTGYQPSQGIHFLYGVCIMITIPAIFAFTHGSNTVRDSLFYGAGMVFIWGLAERALATAVGQ